MREPNPDKLNELVSKLIGDLGVRSPEQAFCSVTASEFTKRWPTARP